MKKIIIACIILVFSICGCASSERAEVEEDSLEQSTECSDEDAMEISSENDESDEDNKRMEILEYINSRVDPLYETALSDEEIEAEANAIWAETEEIYGVSEVEIMSIMSDTDLVKKYYSNIAKKNEITTYDATLEDNGYGIVAIAVNKEILDQYIMAVSNGDENLINTLVESGKLGYETDGTKVNVEDMGVSVSKVKLLEGLNKDMSVYVINEQIEIK